MGVSYEGPAYDYGDDQFELANNAIPESILKKNSVSLAYHLTREGTTIINWRTTCVNNYYNEVEFLTKVLPFGEKRRKFLRKVLMHIYGWLYVGALLWMTTCVCKRYAEHHFSFCLYIFLYYFKVVYVRLIPPSGEHAIVSREIQ